MVYIINFVKNTTHASWVNVNTVYQDWDSISTNGGLDYFDFGLTVSPNYDNET